MVGLTQRTFDTGNQRPAGLSRPEVNRENQVLSSASAGCPMLKHPLQPDLDLVDRLFAYVRTTSFQIQPLFQQAKAIGAMLRQSIIGQCTHEQVIAQAWQSGQNNRR